MHIYLLKVERGGTTGSHQEQRVLAPSPVEQIQHTQGSQGQILTWTLRCSS